MSMCSFGMLILWEMVISAGIRMQSLMRCWKMTMQRVMLIKCSTMAEDLLLFREEENAIEVLETTLSEQDLLAVLKRLRTKVPVRVRKSLAAVEREERVGNDKKEQGYQKKDFGMITGCDEVKNGYLNLTLE